MLLIAFGILMSQVLMPVATIRHALPQTAIADILAGVAVHHVSPASAPATMGMADHAGHHGMAHESEAPAETPSHSGGVTHSVCATMCCLCLPLDVTPTVPKALPFAAEQKGLPVLVSLAVPPMAEPPRA